VPCVEDLIRPFFIWKRQAGSGFEESSENKYEPRLQSLAEWAGERDVSERTSRMLEFEFLPDWLGAFARRHGRQPAKNIRRLLHNAVSSFFDYCERTGSLA
jgi:hypothetical protein